MSGAFWKDLADADGTLSERALPRGAERRIQRRLGASMAQRSMRGPTLVAFTVAVVVGALAVVAVQRARVPAQLDGLRVAQSSRDFASAVAGDQIEIRAGAVTLSDDAAGVQMRADRPVVLKREQRGVRVVRGEVEFQVAKRPASQPTRMLVSHGEIEVHGTRFEVKQRANGGEVTLHEGAISFHCPDGRSLEVRVGETLKWPVPPPPPAAPAPAREPAASVIDDEPIVPLQPLPPDGSADWRTHDRLRRAATLLERIPKLLADGRDGQAIHELEAAMKQDLPGAAREKLSFQLGELLTQGWAVERACRHWKDHVWRYPAGKYEDDVQRARETLGCR